MKTYKLCLPVVAECGQRANSNAQQCGNDPRHSSSSRWRWERNEGLRYQRV